jgi:antagonist of KipI
MSAQVLTPGLMTSVQALDRNGYRHLGVGASGALDEYSMRIANLLVGNRADAPVLEITLSGPRLRFDGAVRLALTGAEIGARVGDSAVHGWRPIDLPARSELALGVCRRGARAYLAINGGVIVPLILGSASTDLRAGFGGIAGRALAAGDVLTFGRSQVVATEKLHVASWWIDPSPDLDFSPAVQVRLLPGHDAVDADADIFAGPYRVSAASNRQGLRLEGAKLRPADPRERVSEPVAPGSVQLPPDGEPIVLLAEAQTIGGYPRIGHVITADFPRLAQLRPGDSLRFEAIDYAGARHLACAQRQRLARIAVAIAARSNEF